MKMDLMVIITLLICTYTLYSYNKKPVDVPDSGKLIVKVANIEILILAIGSFLYLAIKYGCLLLKYVLS